MKELGVHSTTEELLAGVDLSGTRVLVTGVSSGLGNEGVRPYAVDPDRAAVLWAASEELVGERFG